MSKYSNHPLVETLSKRINELVVETHTMRSTHNRTLNELSLVTMRYAKLRDRFKELLYHVPEAVRRQPRFATEDDDESMHLAASRIVYEKLVASVASSAVLCTNCQILERLKSQHETIITGLRKDLYHLQRDLYRKSSCNERQGLSMHLNVSQPVISPTHKSVSFSSPVEVPKEQRADVRGKHKIPEVKEQPKIPDMTEQQKILEVTEQPKIFYAKEQHNNTESRDQHKKPELKKELPKVPEWRVDVELDEPAEEIMFSSRFSKDTQAQSSMAAQSILTPDVSLIDADPVLPLQTSRVEPVKDPTKLTIRAPLKLISRTTKPLQRVASPDVGIKSKVLTRGAVSSRR